jgi:hypothetical protein
MCGVCWRAEARGAGTGIALVPKPLQRRAMARRPRPGMRPCAQAIAASSCCSTHEGLRDGLRGAGNNPRGSSHGSTPASQDAPLCPGHRSVELLLDPRRTSRLDASGLKTTPVGRARARRPRPGMRPCTQASAASSHGSTHARLRDWIPRRWKQPPWVELPLDARVPGSAPVPRRNRCGRPQKKRGTSRCPEIPETT